MSRLFYYKYSYFLILFVITLLIITACDKEVSRSPLEPEPSKGIIYVTSIPSGFTIYKNERNTGRITPDSLTFLEPDNYKIMLKRKYYKDTTITVSLSEQEKKQLQIDYRFNPYMLGKMSLNSEPPNALVIINDSLTNKVTPFTFSGLLPGEYNVKMRLLNHRDSELLAYVYSNETRFYTKVLRDTSVWVDLQTINSDIPTNVLKSITVDQNNVKWIGSFNGLIKYDEISFTNYSTSNSSIPSNTINCISVDAQNRIWIGTNSGIGKFDGNWTIYNKNNSILTSDIINAIHFDNSGNVFIGTAAGLFKFDGSNWTHFSDPLLRDWINDFYIENENKIWIGTKGYGILLFIDGVFDEISKIEFNYPTYTISSVSADQSGNVWFCFSTDSSGRAGISYWNGSNFINYFPGTHQNSIRNIFVDSENNKWVSTSEGLFLFNAQNYQSVFNTQNSLISSNLTTSSVKDLIGHIWIATQNSGLNKFKFNSN